ncbi:anthranilate phosphoribosyltransferase [Granulosicoccaceae sp. 1_MG-2023]|nr:anthranilate phosphoribosyltransferase [Granulosicoccaceae sp. 1_MG-2023]
MTIQQALAAVVDGKDLSTEQMQAVMRQIMTGEASDAQIGGFLVALRMKGETVGEIAAAAGVMRELATPVTVKGDHVVDIVGTGGDVSHTFNISTACTFVVAAAGGKVAKHGNRAVSSASGSADLLEAAGVNLQLSPEQVAECIDEVGVGFMFAPLHHSAMRHAIGPRKEMAIRTVFNVLGPLTNPAGAPNMLLGVFSDALLETMAEVMKRLGARQVMVVHADDGLDEITVSGKTRCAELKNGEITRFEIDPAQFGLHLHPLESIQVNSPQESLGMIREALQNQPGAALDAVLLNSGAALYTAGLAETLDEGIGRAREVIADGQALGRLEALVKKSNAF